MSMIHDMTIYDGHIYATDYDSCKMCLVLLITNTIWPTTETQFTSFYSIGADSVLPAYMLPCMSAVCQEFIFLQQCLTTAKNNSNRSPLVQSE